MIHFFHFSDRQDNGANTDRDALLSGKMGVAVKECGFLLLALVCFFSFFSYFGKERVVWIFLNSKNYLVMQHFLLGL